MGLLRGGERLHSLSRGRTSSRPFARTIHLSASISLSIISSKVNCFPSPREANTSVFTSHWKKNKSSHSHLKVPASPKICKFTVTCKSLLNISQPDITTLPKQSSLWKCFFFCRSAQSTAKPKGHSIRGAFRRKQSTRAVFLKFLYFLFSPHRTDYRNWVFLGMENNWGVGGGFAQPTGASFPAELSSRGCTAPVWSLHFHFSLLPFLLGMDLVWWWSSRGRCSAVTQTCG